MNILDAIEQLTRLKDEHGDVGVAYEAYDDGPEANTVVRLKPLTLEGVGEAEFAPATRHPCVFLDLLAQGDFLPLSEIIAQLSTTHKRHGDIFVTLEADHGHLNNGVRLHYISHVAELGPFFEDDVIDVAPGQLPCVIFSAYSVR